MDQSQPVPAGKPAEAAIADAAKKAFIDFVKQLSHKQSKGFLSEGDSGKIFSFETYLRDLGHSPDIVAAWCHAIKSEDYLATASKKLSLSHTSSNIKVLGKVLFWSMVIAICLYLLVAAVMLIVGVSLWNWKAFIAFVLAGPVLVLIYVSRAYIKLLRKKNVVTGSGNASLFVIKYFDNDELTFAKAKSRLFVEK